MEAYLRYVMEGIGSESPLKNTRHQMLLGDEAFMAEPSNTTRHEKFSAIAKTQRRAVSLSLEEYQVRYPDRNDAMAQAYHSTAYTMEQIAAHFGVSSKTVSRAVNALVPISSCPNVGPDPGG